MSKIGKNHLKFKPQIEISFIFHKLQRFTWHIINKNILHAICYIDNGVQSLRRKEFLLYPLTKKKMPITTLLSYVFLTYLNSFHHDKTRYLVLDLSSNPDHAAQHARRALYQYTSETEPTALVLIIKYMKVPIRLLVSFKAVSTFCTSDGINRYQCNVNRR